MNLLQELQALTGDKTSLRTWDDIDSIYDDGVYDDFGLDEVESHSNEGVKDNKKGEDMDSLYYRISKQSDKLVHYVDDLRHICMTPTEIINMRKECKETLDILCLLCILRGEKENDN